MSLNKMMNEFNELYSVDPIEFTMDNINRTIDLIGDELTEAVEETVAVGSWNDLPIEEVNLHNLAKELTDILYITSQRMLTHGMDVDALLAEVHRSNMSKQVPIDQSVTELTLAKERYPEAIYSLVSGDLGVLTDKATGKVIKPSCYSAAVITDEMVGL